MKTGLKPVLWSGAALLLLLMLAVPVLNLAALVFMMIPYVVLYATLPKQSFVLHLIPVLVIASLLAGLPVLMIGVFFLVPAIIMGHLYRKGASAASVLRTVSIVFLAQLMLELLVFELVLDVSLIDHMSSLVRTTVNDLMAQNLLLQTWNPDATEMLIRMMINSIPLTFIMVSFVYTVLTHYIARRIVIREGVEAAAFAKARDWKLPRVLVFYYLCAYVIEMFISRSSDSFMAVALMNLVPLLSYVFAIQAIGFFFFIAHNRGWSKAVPILLAIPVLFFPPLSLIGVLDTAFPIRKSFTKS